MDDPALVFEHDPLSNLSRAGELITLAAGMQFEEIGRFALGEGSFSTPAIVDEVLYLRTFSHMLAFKGKKVEAR